MNKLKKSIALVFSMVVMSTSVVCVDAASFDGDKAAKYARDYALSYNPNYYDYREDKDKTHPEGRGDCANFASQCLHAGGLKKCKVWTGGKTKSSNTTAWINCIKQKKYLIDNGLGYQAKTYTKLESAPEVCSYLSKGSLVYYDWTNNNSIDHVGIVSMSDSVGRDYICAHTNNRYNTTWTLGKYLSEEEKANIKYYIVKIYK